MTLDGTLALVDEARPVVPVVLFSYLNPQGINGWQLENLFLLNL